MFYRLNVIAIQLPFLRDARRTSRCSSTTSWTSAEESRKPGLVLTPEAMDRLASYDWPGSVRELGTSSARGGPLPRTGDRAGPDSRSGLALTSRTAANLDSWEGIRLEEVMLGQERRYIEAALDAAGGVRRGRELLREADDAQ